MPSRKIQIAIIAAVCITLAGFYGAHVLGSRTQAQNAEASAPVDHKAQERLSQAEALQGRKKWSEANALYRLLAADGHPVAMYGLARAYKYGWGVPTNLETARDWFKKAVRFDFAYRGEAAYEIGRLYQRSAGEKCDEIAVAWFNRALAWQFDKAHVELAYHHRYGVGVDRDPDAALYHFKRAAAAGETYATLKYAQWLLNGGDGIEPNEERAHYWGRRAIEGLVSKAGTGSGSAAKTLGRLYRDGAFVDPSTPEAERWFRRSSRLGDTGGMHELALLLLRRPNHETRVFEALELLRLASERGHGGAVTMLGRLHLAKSFGLSETEAVSFFEKGVALRHPGSMEELARLLAQGRLIGQDKERALRLARDGAKMGHEGARSLLSEFESHGRRSSMKIGKT